MADQIPIDIKYNELLNWMFDRYYIPSDWPKRYELLQVKKNELIDNILNYSSTDELIKIKDFINSIKGDVYFEHIMKINQLLLKTGLAKSKSMFGNYNDPIVYNSYLITTLYSKNNLTLVEFSKIIIQNIGYEIPNCNKNIGYYQKSISEINFKINEKQNYVLKLEERIKNLIINNNIPISNKYTSIDNFNSKVGDNYNEKCRIILNELISKQSELQPNILALEKKIIDKKINEIINHYEKFYIEVHSRDRTMIDHKDFLSELKKINKIGDYLLENTNQKNKYEIIKSKQEEYTNKYGMNTLKTEISTEKWDLNLFDQLSDKIEEKVSNTALLCSKTRNILFNNILELSIFVKQRLIQITHTDEINLSMYNKNLRDINNEVSSDTLVEYDNYLNTLLSYFENNNFNSAFSLFDNEKNFLKIINQFIFCYNEIEKSVKFINDSRNKISEIDSEINEQQKRIIEFKKIAKSCKKDIEKSLTTNLKRKVTIIGDVNLF